jgi:hypothetical protein
MSLQLFAHPFSSYCQKALIALYENDLPFEWRQLSPEHPENAAEHAAMWPLRRMPLLLDDGRSVMEASIIIEHLGLYHPGPVRLIPEDPRAALEVRMIDRFFDNDVMAPMMAIVFDRIRPAEHRDPYGVDQARALLDTASSGSRAAWPSANGRRAASAWPTVPRRRRCSTPTGRIRSVRRSVTSAPIGSGCWRGRRSSERSMKRGRIGRTSHSGRRIATELATVGRRRPSPHPRLAGAGQ